MRKLKGLRVVFASRSSAFDRIVLVLLVSLVVNTFLFFSPTTSHADLLQDIKKRGEIVVGVKDSIPPFGFIDPSTRTIVGYDIDFAAAIAKALGVKLKTIPVTTATRIPELMQGKIDLIIATMTHSPERAQQIDFTHTYFVTGQKVLARKNAGISKVADLKGKRVSSVRGSTSEQNIRRAVSGVQVISFNDYPNAFLALAQRKVVAMTTDEIILMDLQRRSPKPDDYQLIDEYISTEPYGIGVRKGEPALVKEVNRVLIEMEKSGEAARVFDRWFGPKSDTPLKRTFVIGK
jgi:polar amino acid transport system substrate-binding protein